MEREHVWRHVDHQRADLADFLDGLSPAQWSAQSLCADWTVRDVAAHLTHTTTSWSTFGIHAVRSGFRFDRMVSRLARDDTREPAEITAALRAMIGDRRRPPGTNVIDPLMDLLVHGQDVAVALGVPREMPREAAVAVAERLWGMGFPLHPRKRFPGVTLAATDADFTVGAGPRVEGAIADVVLALAGRDAGRAALSGARPSAADG